MGLNSDGQSQSQSQRHYSDSVHKRLELNWMERRDNEDVQQRFWRELLYKTSWDKGHELAIMMMI